LYWSQQGAVKRKTLSFLYIYSSICSGAPVGLFFFASAMMRFTQAGTLFVLQSDADINGMANSARRRYFMIT
jgi:hypothetical protein